MCAGWVAVHDMVHNLAFRFASRNMTPEDADAILDYKTTVPLFSSGQEAADHGLRDLKDPALTAKQKIRKLQRKKLG